MQERLVTLKQKNKPTYKVNRTNTNNIQTITNNKVVNKGK